MTKNNCAAPWRGLHIQVDGGISTCCAGAFKLGNINTDTIDSALSNEKLKEVRATIKSGVLHKEYCRTCIMASKNKIKSEMDWHNSLNGDFDLDSAGLDYQFPVIFDARWNNTCNSACTYCSSMFSSKWASLLSEQDNKPVKDNLEKIKLFFSKNNDKLKTVAMVGGEPLLMKENAELLDLIPTNVTVDVISNFSVDITRSKVFEKLLARRKVLWHISMENVGGRYEYVRQESNWQRVIDNLKILGKEVRNPPEKNDHELQFFSLYHLFNSTRLCEFKEFASEALSFFPYKFGKRHPSKNIEIVWQNFQEPAAICLDHYGKDVLDGCIVELEKYLSTDVLDNEKNFFSEKVSRFKNVNTNTSTDTRNKLKRFIQSHETIFKNHGKFKELWPEFSSMLD
jgi:radical SAM protein with 4Fe4S-binding SPASM domain